jgi:hypothetical protein
MPDAACAPPTGGALAFGLVARAREKAADSVTLCASVIACVRNGGEIAAAPPRSRVVAVSASAATTVCCCPQVQLSSMLQDQHADSVNPSRSCEYSSTTMNSQLSG